MNHRDALFRSTGIVFCILAFFAVVMSIWLNALKSAPILNPIVTLKWIHTPSAFDSTEPEAAWDDLKFSVHDLDQEGGVDQLWDWIDRQILMEDIETQGISNDPIDLKYIDFFAGREFGDHQYAAYRLLKRSDMFRLSAGEYREEIEYLFPDLPINIQGAQEERLLNTTDEVVAWKTEVLEQQAYVGRLRQYLAKRRFEEHDRIDLRQSSHVFEVKMKPEWRGWVQTKGVMSIEGCTSIPFTQYVYRVGSKPITIPLPWWVIKSKSVDCLRKYESLGTQSLTHLEIKLTEDNGYLNPHSMIWRLQKSNCKSTVHELRLECLLQK